ncbi:MAG: class I SAM-dependent methyltransferase [Dehalococcoidales bacterium]|nr:class I SAM-dependent methyltransferase [Dehalococcoidales bacterium]
MVEALPAAKRIWNSSEEVQAMDNLWDVLEGKPDNEAALVRLAQSVPHGKLLDLGCGSARYAQLVKGWRTYTGVDSSPHMAELAQKRLGQLKGRAKSSMSLLQANLLEWHPEKGHHYDLVLCIEVAQHYENPLEFARRMLSINYADYLLLTVQTHSKAEGTVDFWIGWEGYEDGSNVGSRTVAMADLKAILSNYDVLAFEPAPHQWHPDSRDQYILTRLKNVG